MQIIGGFMTSQMYVKAYSRKLRDFNGKRKSDFVMLCYLIYKAVQRPNIAHTTNYAIMLKACILILCSQRGRMHTCCHWQHSYCCEKLCPSSSEAVIKYEELRSLFEWGVPALTRVTIVRCLNYKNRTAWAPAKSHLLGIEKRLH